jgi:DNA polymerase (family 10)
MDLETARRLASEVIDKLRPYCKPERCREVGSVRRGKPLCRDVDIVLIPAEHCQGRLAMALRGLGEAIKSGPLIHSCRYRGQQVDIYVATEETWWTLLLIRTGSKEHNVRLCARARSVGMKLHADGSGITLKDGVRQVPQSEEDIFAALGLPYEPPEKRM